MCCWRAWTPGANWRLESHGAILMSSAPEPRTLRSFFQKRLAALAKELGTVTLAALATEDGLLIATNESLQPNPTDRRGAVMASLSAVARASAPELNLGEALTTQIDCSAGRLLVLPFETQQDSGPRRRLLFVALDPTGETAVALEAMHRLIHAIAARVAPAG